MPVGMVRNIFPVLVEFDGLRDVLTGPKNALLVFLLVSAVFSAFLHILRGARLDAPEGFVRAHETGPVGGNRGLLFTLVPLLIWDPQYEKLWLQPIVLLAFLIAIALKIPVEANRVPLPIFSHGSPMPPASQSSGISRW